MRHLQTLFLHYIMAMHPGNAIPGTKLQYFLKLFAFRNEVTFKLLYTINICTSIIMYKCITFNSEYIGQTLMMILGVSPLRGFPVEGRGIGHLVPILCGRRLAGLVRLGGGVCPSAGCPVGTVVQLVGSAPTLHGALGGRRASAGYGPVSGASVSAQPSAGRTRAWWPHRDTTSR